MIEQLVANGIIFGCIIALAAIGLSMAYRILNFANFAHGDFLTLGAYLASSRHASLNIDFVAACALAIMVTCSICHRPGLCGLETHAIEGCKQDRHNDTINRRFSLLRNLLIIIFNPDVKRFPLPVREGMSSWWHCLHRLSDSCRIDCLCSHADDPCALEQDDSWKKHESAC